MSEYNKDAFGALLNHELLFDYVNYELFINLKNTCLWSMLHPT